MKKVILLGLLVFVFSCKDNKIPSKDNLTIEDKEQSVLTKVADAYGFENWNKVEKVDFTFVVNPGENERARKWTWEPKSNIVTLHAADEKITYNRNKLDEKYISTDKAFVNDSFWLTVPFHLVWDELDHQIEENYESPLGNKASTKITINYTDNGGYTPGDKYDIYINENFQIIEWSYFPKGQNDAALTNTFEDLSDFDGIKVNTTHRNPNIGFQLNFRDVSFK